LPHTNSPVTNGSESKKNKKAKQTPAPNKPKGHKDKTPSPANERDFSSPIYNDADEEETGFAPDYEPSEEDEDGDQEQKPPPEKTPPGSDLPPPPSGFFQPRRS
jgi:hypothetical protein